MISSVDRRTFLRSSVLATACGVARIVPAASESKSGLIDTHVYCGHWPLRSLKVETPAELTKSLRHANVTQAWVGSFEGLFQKDIHGVNERLTKACRSVENGLLMPVGTVNPTLPDWEEDVARCQFRFGMRGIRVHPTYHGYVVDDSRFTRLLRLAAQRSMFVQLVASLPVTKSRLLYPLVVQTDLSRLAEVVRPIRGLRLLVSCVHAESNNNRWPELGSDTFVEMNAGDFTQLRLLVDRYSSNRVVVGSIAPLVDVTAEKLARNAADESARLESITHRNATRLLRGT